MQWQIYVQSAFGEANERQLGELGLSHRGHDVGAGTSKMSKS